MFAERQGSSSRASVIWAVEVDCHPLPISQDHTSLVEISDCFSLETLATIPKNR